MKVAIIGYGWVGKAMKELFPDALVYIRDRGLKATDSEYISNKDFTMDRKRVNECDVAFIAVPTPNSKDGEGVPPNNVNYRDYKGEGRLDTSAVEENIAWCECPVIVVRSTVNPGDCDRWAKKYNKEIVMQPEYLGETPNHPLLDTINTPFLIFGGTPKGIRTVIDLYTTVYNANVSIRKVTALEAEVIKLTENRAIAFKVAQAQELYDVCEKAGVDYYTVREAVYGDDPRFNRWWTFIYRKQRGFNSKCIPKDVYAWCAWAESAGYEPKITRALLEKNKEWINK